MAAAKAPESAKMVVFDQTSDETVASILAKVDSSRYTVLTTSPMFDITGVVTSAIQKLDRHKCRSTKVKHAEICVILAAFKNPVLTDAQKLAVAVNIDTKGICGLITDGILRLSDVLVTDFTTNMTEGTLPRPPSAAASDPSTRN